MNKLYKILAPLTIAVLLLISALVPFTAEASVNVTPDVVFNGNDVFQGTSVNMPIPSGLTLGMIIVVAITFGNSQSSQSAVTIAGGTSGASWTSFGVTPSSPDEFAFYKIADAGDVADSAAGGQSWVITCSDGNTEQWAGAAWSGVNTGSPFATGPGTNFGNSTTFSFASQTSPGAGSVWVGLLMSRDDPSTLVNPGPPVVQQEESTSPFFQGPAIVYSATGVTGAFAPSGSVALGFEWATVGFFLNPGTSVPPGEVNVTVKSGTLTITKDTWTVK